MNNDAAFEILRRARSRRVVSPLSILGSSNRLWTRGDLGLSLGATLRATGTTPPVLTISGTTAQPVWLRVECTTLGARGVWQFRWSSDGGATFPPAQSNILSAASVPLGSTGITLAIAAGNAAVDNFWESTIAGWADQSGNAQNWVQNTDTAQLLGVKNGINSVPILRANGSSTFMSTSGFPSLAAGEIFAVLKAFDDPSTAPTGSGGLWSWGTEAANDHHPFTNSLCYNGWGSTTRRAPVGDPVANLALPHVLNIRSSATEWSFWVNGALVFTTGVNVVGFLASPVIGKTVSVFSKHDWGELIVSDRVLDSVTRLQMNAYLTNLWGIAIA